MPEREIDSTRELPYRHVTMTLDLHDFDCRFDPSIHEAKTPHYWVAPAFGNREPIQKEAEPECRRRAPRSS
jgi:hypothetical protein